MTEPRRWTDEELDKAVAVVLNHVEGLRWAYYNVDLVFDDQDEPGIESVLAKIERTTLGWEWNGTSDDERALLPSLLRVLDDEPAAAHEIFRRIFDINNIPGESGADAGLAGKLNRADRKYREERYLADVRSGKCQTRPVLVAEGDSWFEFPGVTLFKLGRFRIHKEFVREIIDQLIKSGRYCIKSIAAGGDWLSNMLRTEDYIEPLSRIEPDAFLFSGGGNDLLAEGRVANMVRHKRRLSEPEEFTRHAEDLVEHRCTRGCATGPTLDEAKYALGAKFLSKDFVSFMNLALVQYYLFFAGLTNSKLNRMAILTQGYDYPIPTRKTTAPWYSLRHWVNRGLGSGKWLWMPLEQKRLNEEEKRAVAYALITEFNELLISLARCGHFPRLYHVDLRGTARSRQDWYDEIHLSSDAFARAAAVYETCLRDVLSDKPSGHKVFHAVERASSLPA